MGMENAACPTCNVRMGSIRNRALEKLRDRNSRLNARDTNRHAGQASAEHGGFRFSDPFRHNATVLGVATASPSFNFSTQFSFGS
eukprot:361573-Hanusia_phi.AAC.1